jgi:hypothetical protein
MVGLFIGLFICGSPTVEFYRPSVVSSPPSPWTGLAGTRTRTRHGRNPRSYAGISRFSAPVPVRTYAHLYHRALTFPLYRSVSCRLHSIAASHLRSASVATACITSPCLRILLTINVISVTITAPHFPPTPCLRSLYAAPLPCLV